MPAHAINFRCRTPAEDLGVQAQLRAIARECCKRSLGGMKVRQIAEKPRSNGLASRRSVTPQIVPVAVCNTAMNRAQPEYFQEECILGTNGRI